MSWVHENDILWGSKVHFEDWYHMVCNAQHSQQASQEASSHAQWSMESSQWYWYLHLQLWPGAPRPSEMVKYFRTDPPLNWLSQIYDHVSHLESRFRCKDLWLVMDFLHFVSLLTICGSFCLYASSRIYILTHSISRDQNNRSSLSGQWSGLFCSSITAYTNLFQLNQMLSFDYAVLKI